MVSTDSKGEPGMFGQPMIHHSFLKRLGALWAAAVVALALIHQVHGSSPQEKPNIIFILGGDHRWLK
jgi:hypothetical protein